MIETPALISRPPVKGTLATTALILGIVGIVVPIVGIILGILAIIFGIIALKQKTTHSIPAIIGIITGGIAILWGVVLILLISVFASHSFSLLPASDRDLAVTAQLNAQKNFKLGETAKIGPMDVTITKFERNYTLTPAEAQLAKGTPPSEVVPNTAGYDHSVPIDESDAEYVKVEGTAMLNDSQSLGDFSANVSSMELNNVEPYIFNDGLGRFHQLTSQDPTTVVYVYRVRKDSPQLTLKYETIIFTSVLLFVGTEGAPSKQLTYTIALN
ncbi:MAG TPA: hypothetical protein VIM31_04695 [Candidatus Microsaccharimonas sp.]|jgi:hypothetical protein